MSAPDTTAIRALADDLDAAVQRLVPDSKSKEAEAMRIAYIQHCRAMGFHDRDIAATLGVRAGSLSEFMRAHGLGRVEFNHARKERLK